MTYKYRNIPSFKCLRISFAVFTALSVTLWADPFPGGEQENLVGTAHSQGGELENYWLLPVFLHLQIIVGSNLWLDWKVISSRYTQKLTLNNSNGHTPHRPLQNGANGPIGPR